MTTKHEHNGIEYWITIDNAIHPLTNKGCYTAFVKDQEPDGLILGKQVKDENGEVKFFADRNTALIYAQDVVQSEIDGGIQGFF